MRLNILTSAALACLFLEPAVRAIAAPPSDPCSLLTAAQISAALGATASDGKPITASVCQWSAPGKDGGSQKVALTIGNAQKFAFAKMPVNSPRITKTPVSGIGDEAVFGTTAGQAASINVKKGDTYFSISVIGAPMDKAQELLTTLAKEALSKL